MHFCLLIKSHFTFYLNSVDKTNDNDYVTQKLNHAFFKKLQSVGGSRGKEEKRNDSPNRSKSVQRRRRSSVANLDQNTNVKITKPERRNSIMEDERAIHDAYHTLLGEFQKVRNTFSSANCE